MHDRAVTLHYVAMQQCQEPETQINEIYHPACGQHTSMACSQALYLKSLSDTLAIPDGGTKTPSPHPSSLHPLSMAALPPKTHLLSAA